MIETDSATWREVAAWAEAAAQQSRAVLEAPATGWERTQYERGRLAALGELLRLGQPAVPIQVGAETYGL